MSPRQFSIDTRLCRNLCECAYLEFARCAFGDEACLSVERVECGESVERVSVCDREEVVSRTERTICLGKA